MTRESPRPNPALAAGLAVAAALALPGLSARADGPGPGTDSEPTRSAPAGGPATKATAMPPGHPTVGASTAEPGLSGTVLETIDSGGYTYLKLKTAKGETWAAITQARVEKGSTVTIAAPMPMDGFESKTLNRKFERIVFGTLQTAPDQTAGAATEAMKASMAAQHATAASGPEVGGKVSVAKAEGPEGRTVAELFAGRAELKGRTVAVRGKVVKFSARIMGRNWIHLRDGSGSRDAKDDDLTVTTPDSAQVGDIVLVRGVVALDRDFGAGYSYPLLVEDARVSPKP